MGISGVGYFSGCKRDFGKAWDGGSVGPADGAQLRFMVSICASFPSGLTFVALSGGQGIDSIIVVDKVEKLGGKHMQYYLDHCGSISVC